MGVRSTRSTSSDASSAAAWSDQLGSFRWQMELSPISSLLSGSRTRITPVVSGSSWGVVAELVGGHASGGERRPDVLCVQANYTAAQELTIAGLFPRLYVKAAGFLVELGSPYNAV